MWKGRIATKKKNNNKKGGGGGGGGSPAPRQNASREYPLNRVPFESLRVDTETTKVWLSKLTCSNPIYHAP